VASTAELLEKPLPSPKKDLLGYAGARMLEALLESLLALEFLEKGYTRNAAGKAFQAWKALVGVISALEKDKLAETLKTEEQKKWLTEIGILRVPTTKLKRLAQLIEDAGYTSFTHYTSTALDLHNYQYYGPDPDRALSEYTTPEEAVKDTLLLLRTLVELVEDKLKPKLGQANAWTEKHEQALQQLKKRLGMGKE